MADFVIDSWTKLNVVHERLDVGDGFNTPYLFRGHESAAWRLEPTLHRAATQDGARALPDAETLLRFERAATSQFKQAAPNQLSPATFGATKADVDWWTVMRHYGAPTRLLDWTASIFVAAYFACRGRPTDDGSIYLLHEHSLRVAMRRLHGDAADAGLAAKAVHNQLNTADAPDVVELFARRTALPQRMIVQRGLFMLCRNVAGDVEAILSEAMKDLAKGPAETFRAIPIPAALKPELMRRLREVNITGATLFPDLDGIGRSLDEVVRWR